MNPITCKQEALRARVRGEAPSRRSEPAVLAGDLRSKGRCSASVSGGYQRCPCASSSVVLLRLRLQIKANENGVTTYLALAVPCCPSCCSLRNRFRFFFS